MKQPVKTITLTEREATILYVAFRWVPELDMINLEPGEVTNEEFDALNERLLELKESFM